MSWKEIDPITTRMSWDIMKLKLGDSILVKDIMRRNTPRISKDRSMKDAVGILEETRDQCLLVVDKEDITGILTKRDVETALTRKDGQRAKVGALMSPVSTVSGDATLLEATRIMGESGSRHGLVRDDNGAIVGQTSLDDILIVSPELIRVFCTLENLVGLALESEVDLRVHLRGKINDICEELLDLKSTPLDEESREFKAAFRGIFKEPAQR
ncbi:MAG: CBS domain-containing protein [Candidatus Hydrothermarchaeaceae archaeon]